MVAILMRQQVRKAISGSPEGRLYEGRAAGRASCGFLPSGLIDDAARLSARHRPAPRTCLG
jgi:hypothetical protein